MIHAVDYFASRESSQCLKDREIIHNYSAAIKNQRHKLAGKIYVEKWENNLIY